MARVVRTGAAARAAVRAGVPHPQTLSSAPLDEAALVLELGDVRVSIRPGFDRATLALVLEVLGVKGGGQ